MTALDYIQRKGLKFKTRAGQLILETCPYCHDEKYHFYIDQQQESGPFFCHKCNQRGNLITLQKHLGDRLQRPDNGSSYKAPRKPQGGITAAFPEKGKPYHYPDEQTALKAHEQLLQDAAALEYITKTRGISLETVRAFKIGLEVDRDVKWLSIPHYEKGKLINVKYRSLPPAERAFKRLEGCKSILFNSDVLQGVEEIFIAEGELDCLTLIDRGNKNAVSGTTGAGSFDPAWIDQLEKIKKIYLAYDADEAGRKGARELARRLGYERTYNIELPDGQDVNDYFQQHDIFEFQALVNQARRFDIVGVMDIERGLELLQSDIDKPEQTTGISTGWASVDRHIKTGFCPGELIVLSAPPKIGKSTFALQISSYNALQDIPALFYSLEMRPMKLIQKIVQCHSWKPNITNIQIEETRQAYTGKPLYLGYCYQKPTLDGIVETIKQAVRRYGLRLLVFDHLHFLCRSINNQVQEVGLAVQAFKFLAEEMEIAVVLIAQPRKVNPDAIMTAQDLKDSSSIYSDCDHLILMHRKRKTSNGKAEGLQDMSFDPVTLIRVEASRYNAGGETLLYFHGDYSRFDEMTNRYGADA